MALGSMKKKYTSPLATGKVLQADEVSSAVSTTVYSLIYDGINNKISITNKGEDVLSSSVCFCLLIICEIRVMAKII